MSEKTEEYSANINCSVCGSKNSVSFTYEAIDANKDEYRYKIKPSQLCSSCGKEYRYEDILEKIYEKFNNKENK